jgi:hypothetical protein
VPNSVPMRAKNGLCDGFQSRPLRHHANVRVMLQHRLAQVPSDGHDGLLAGLPFSELVKADQAMTAASGPLTARELVIHCCDRVAAIWAAEPA